MKPAKISLCLDLSLWLRGSTTSIGLCTEKIAQEVLRLAPERGLEVEVYSRDGWASEARASVQKTFGDVAWAPWTRRWQGKSPGQVFLSFDHRTLPVRGARRAIVVHDAWTLRDNPWQSPEFQQKQRPKVLASLAAADLVFCPSQATLTEAKAYTANPNTRFVYLPWGPMVDVAQPLAGGFASRTLVMVANFERRKNHAWAHRLALALGPEWKWVFVGADGYGASESRALVRDLQARGYHVQERQKLDSDEVKKVYAEAHAVISPSHEEGFGLTVLEAMRMGRPVWASDISPHHEIAADAGRYLDPCAQDLEVLASDLVRNAGDESRYENQVLQGWQRSQKFSWSLSGAKLMDSIERLARRA